MTKRLFFVLALMLLASCVLCAQTPGNAAAAEAGQLPAFAGWGRVRPLPAPWKAWDAIRELPERFSWRC
jgi:hypothetical protein